MTGEHAAQVVGVGDLNNDKRSDIIVIAHDSYAVTILLQNERGQFDADRMLIVQAHKGEHPHTHDVAVGDVNGDGALDILTTNEDDCAVSVLLGDGIPLLPPGKSVKLDLVDLKRLPSSGIVVLAYTVAHSKARPPRVRYVKSARRKT